MRHRAFIALAALSGALVSGGWLLQRGLERGDSVYGRARLFDDVMAHLSQYYVDTLSEQELYNKAVDGMLQQLHDPYSVFLSAERLRKLNESTSGVYAGLGVQIDVRDGWITIIAPLPGTPAERAGIQPGDRIVAVDGRSTQGWTVDEARQALRGERGSRVTLSVERPGVAARIPFTLQRADIHVRSVRHARMLSDSVGYVQLTIFSEASADELRSAIGQLRRNGMKTLIFDLRSNPGGLLEQGVEVAELFLDPGEKIVSMRGRALGATREFTDDDRQLWPDLKLITLVDDHSASAAEIVAGALQDHDRSAILGTTTYGKGSAQSVFPLREGDGALKLTTARWFTPAGRSIQKQRKDTTADSDSDGEPLDSTETPQEVPLSERAAFRTDGGRTVYGGGGITPDVIVASSDSTDSTVAFYRTLGPDIPRFRDALTDYALSLKGSRGVRSPDFVVTPAMRDEFWRRLQAKGVKIDRTHFDAARPVMDKLLGYEIERYLFGPEAEFQRQARDDRVVAAALELAAGARSEHDLLARASERRAQKREDVPRKS
jgi:carboxyl-terminal processing protease